MERINFEKFEVNSELREITFSCASGTPYERYDERHDIVYDEILIVNENSVDLSRLNNGAPLLFNHDTDKLLGMVEKAYIAGDRVYVQVRLSKNDAFADRIWRDILDGLIKNVSIGYTVQGYEDKREDGTNKRYVTRWMIYECSIVSIPADNEVGIRQFNIKETKTMCNEENKELEQEQENLEQEDTEKVTETDEKVEETQENTEAEKTDGEQTIEDVKAELEALKAKVAELEKPAEEKSEVDEEAKEEMQKIAEDFNVPEEEVQRAIEKKLTVREFKHKVKNFNIITKKEQKMQKFTDYLKTRQFDKPFVMRDFAGFADADLVGTTTTPLVAALDKRLGVKGYRTISGLNSNLSIPVQSTRIQVAEQGINSNSVDSNPGFNAVTLSPKKITGSVLIGKQMLYNTNSDVEAFVIDGLLKEISYKIETMMLGKIADGAATEINYNAISAITWQDVLAFEAAIGAYLVNETSFVMSPAARATLKGIAKSQTAVAAGFICEGNEVNGYPVNVTGCAVNDNIYFGDFSELVLATWSSGIEILVDPFSESRAGNVVIVASALVDAAVVQKDAFAIGKVQESSNSNAL